MKPVSPPRAAGAVFSGLHLLRHLPLTARLLIACRVARSVGQGALVTDFALYLGALHWDAVQMGAVYMGGLTIGAVLTMTAGPLSDSVGRKPFLIGYEIAQLLAAGLALATAQPAWLALASVVGAYGRGANGAAGPFGPVEQAWLSDCIPEGDFGAVYSLNAAAGFLGMAAGSLFAALPALWSGALPGPLRYRPLFLLVLLGSLLSLALLTRMRETRGAARHPVTRPPQPAAAHPRGRAMLAKLVGINTLNGLAIGVIGPFMAFWFHLRYGEGPAAIGPVLALGFVLGSFASVWTGWLSRRLGTTEAVVVMRLAGLVLLVALPFMPSFGLAAGCYVLRAAFNRGTAGARQAVGLLLVGRDRRGLAASLNAISMQIPRALGPVVGGWLLDAQFLAAPMLLAAALQAIYLVLYGVTFRRIDGS